MPARPAQAASSPARARSDTKPSSAAEFEFFVFKETPASLHAKGFRGLEPLSPGMFGYSWVREGQNADLCHAILDDMERFGIPIEGLHTETGPGVYEVAIQYDEALRAADKAALFKTAMKQVASRLGYSRDVHGQVEPCPPRIERPHSPVALEGRARTSSSTPARPHKLSALARHYLGGQVALMPELTALISPTINSYKRYVPGVWAPLNASWGIENRTCAIRAIPGSAKSTRLEYRQTAADINPYIAMATTLAAGLWGIEQGSEPPPPVEGDASAPGRSRAAAANLARGHRPARPERHARAAPGRGVRRPLRADARLGVPAVRARRHRVGAGALLRERLAPAAGYLRARIGRGPPVLRLAAMGESLVTWSFPTTIVFGVGAVATVGDHVKRLGARRALLVCDAGVVKVGIAERVRSLLEAAGVAAAIFDKVDPNPVEENIFAGVAAYRAHGAECIVVASAAARRSTPASSSRSRSRTSGPSSTTTTRSTAGSSSARTCPPSSPSPRRRAPAARSAARGS